MKTRYTPLVKIKKNMMDRSEQHLQHAHHKLQDAETALVQAYEELKHASAPQSGAMSDFLHFRAVIEMQRQVVDQKHQEVLEAASDVQAARTALKQAMVEYEKFKYLETEQIKLMIEEQKRVHQRELDEIAVRSFTYRKEA